MKRTNNKLTFIWPSADDVLHECPFYHKLIDPFRQFSLIFDDIKFD
jgi:hypothetical protein